VKIKQVLNSGNSKYIHRLLRRFYHSEGLGKTRLIAEAKVKMDRVDAKTLAGLLRADMLPTCYVPGEELRSRRELLRHRLNLVKTRTGVKNRIPGLLDKHGLHMHEATPFSKGNVAWLRGPPPPSATARACFHPS